jgi:high-affinity iron transporter
MNMLSMNHQKKEPKQHEKKLRSFNQSNCSISFFLMLWNTGAFFVLFREALEAAIILGVLHRYVEQTVTENSMKRLAKRYIWMGALIGLVISLSLSTLLTIVFYTLQKDVFGTMKPLFEGTLQLIAVVLLTWLSFKMLKSSILYRKWEEKIVLAAQEKSSQAKAFMVLSFSIIIREGLESVIFMAGVTLFDSLG